jgi:hypothetical protein
VGDSNDKKLAAHSQKWIAAVGPVQIGPPGRRLITSVSCVHQHPAMSVVQMSPGTGGRGRLVPVPNRPAERSQLWTSVLIERQAIIQTVEIGLPLDDFDYFTSRPMRIRRTPITFHHIGGDRVNDGFPTPSSYTYHRPDMNDASIPGSQV